MLESDPKAHGRAQVIWTSPRSNVQRSTKGQWILKRVNPSQDFKSKSFKGKHKSTKSSFVEIDPIDNLFLIELSSNLEVKPRLLVNNKNPSYWSNLSVRTRKGKTYYDPESSHWTINCEENRSHQFICPKVTNLKNNNT